MRKELRCNLTRAAAYARYSTDRQCSTEVQLQKITEFCKKNSLSLEAMYVDEGITGTNTHRSGFTDMLKAAANKEFDCVVIYDITRGSRDVADWFNFRKQMVKLGIQVISTQDKLGDITNPNDFLQELLSVGIGQHHVLSTRIKSKDAIVTRAKKGKFCGGTAPLGYDIVNGDYVINEREAVAVRHIFESYANGASYANIIDWLHENGYVGKLGQTLGKNSLFSILRNERYVGTFSWNKRIVKFMSQWAGGQANPDVIVIEDIIPKIIDTEIWERVQIRMKENKKNTLNKSRVNREYILSGIIRCGKCGGSFVGVTTINKKGIEYKFYSCANKKRLRTCDCKNIAANDIEPLIINLLKNEILNSDLIEKTADTILATYKFDNQNNTKAIREEISQLDSKIENLLKSFENGLDSDALRARLADHEGRRKILKTKLAKALPIRPISRGELISQLSVDIKLLHENPEKIKQLLNKYIVKIEVDNTTITVYAIKDLKEKTLELVYSNVLTTSGCGSRT